MDDGAYETHLFSYRFDGSEWSIDIPARNADEAKRRLSALLHARYDGVLVARIPVALGPFAKLYAAFRNFFTSPVR